MPTKRTVLTTAAPKPGLFCAFCRRDQRDVATLVAGPGVHICDACVARCSRVLTGRPTAAFAGWASLTDDELLATLPASVAAVDGAQDKLRRHVQLLRERGLSWERIAVALGITRQAAWERFARTS